MKTLVTSFATDKSGTVSIEHGLAIVDISLGLVVIIGHICRQLNVLSKTVFTAERRRGRGPPLMKSGRHGPRLSTRHYVEVKSIP
jgi:Flp pilus assembly pilin Flp